MTGARILIYSHDTFGLGHLRRARTIAHALVEEYSSLSVLILSGSPLVGSFDFKARVDFVRVPGVIKLRNGAYTSLGLHIDLDQTMAPKKHNVIETKTTTTTTTSTSVAAEAPKGSEGAQDDSDTDEFLIIGEDKGKEDEVPIRFMTMRGKKFHNIEDCKAGLR